MSRKALIKISQLFQSPGRGTLVAAVACLAMAGCSSSTPVAYQELASAQHLHPVKDDEKPFQYRNPTVRWASYAKILIDPVSIYDGRDGQFGSVSAEDRQIIADYMKTEFAETLGGKYQIVQAADPTAVRLHLTLTGIEKSTPVLSTISHLAPIGIVVNGGLQAAGSNGTSFGSVSYAVELLDAATGALLDAYVTRQTPDALDVTASIGYLDAAKEGVRIGATHLEEDLSKAGFSTVSNR